MTKQNKPIKGLRRDVLVLLCAPVQEDDLLTNYTSNLLQTLPPLKQTTIFKKFSEPLTYESLLTELSIKGEDDVAVVFWGHGNESSLLGPPAATDPQDKTCFYDATSIDSGPKYMLAMCCSAAIGLARAFDGRDDRAFIGFDRPIPFVLAGGVYAEWWTKIVHGCADAMLQFKNVDDLRAAVQQIYKLALSVFPTDSKREHGLLMNGYLLKQLESIDFVRT